MTREIAPATRLALAAAVGAFVGHLVGRSSIGAAIGAGAGVMVAVGEGSTWAQLRSGLVTVVRQIEQQRPDPAVAKPGKRPPEAQWRGDYVDVSSTPVE